MFVQVISARARDRAMAEAYWKTWERDLQPGAVGWLGCTAGISDDDRFIAVARFESSEAARQNSERAEQREWWAEMSACLEDVAFLDCPDVDVMLRGPSPDARFVQIIEGSTRDKHRMRVLNHTMEEVLERDRPDLIGSLIAWHGRARFVEVVYFTSEEAARAAESREFPGGLMAFFEELTTLMGGVRFVDLREPWHSER